MLTLDRLPARGGGGHSFGGGGGSRGGGFTGGRSHFFFFGGGGGGGGGLAAIIGIVVVVVLALVVFRAIKARRQSQEGGVGGPGAGTAVSTTTGPPPGTAWSHDDRPAIDSVRGGLFPGSASQAGMAGGGGSGESVADGLAAISAHDPAFDREAFLEQAQRGFFIVEEAWTERKPTLSRQVMAEGLWQQHRVQINGYVAEHKRNVLGDLAVGNMDIVSATSDASYDTITVRVRAACRDYDVNDAGKVVRGNKEVGEWAEDWTFQRSSKATTQPGGGTLSQRCPNCGAPLDVDLAGMCSYCKAPVMSGDYDWVLSRISQLQ